MLVTEAEHFDEAETLGILTAEPAQKRSAETAEKMARCGLDYDAQLIARNLRLLLPA